MTCDEVRELLSAYQDGELPPSRRDEIAAHLGSCPECAAVLRGNLHLSQAIREQAPTYPPPESLLRSIGQRRRRRVAWPPFAAGLSLGLAGALAGLFLLPRQATKEFSAELVSDHVRSLMASHLVDVQSSDKHTVKPWFLGRLDFSPAVPDLGASGYPLLGGRLEYVAGRSAAALVYKKASHVINVLVMPERPGYSATPDVNGYHVEHWRMGDLGYWAVSDIPGLDLRSFAKAFQAGAGL